jgi:formate hydrogenlyase subunit 4
MILINVFLSLILAPLFPGIINKIKAFFAGRKGPPVLQLYFDLYKLIQKKDVYSTTSSWILKINPLICIVSMILLALFIPFAKQPSLLSFGGDIIFLAYLFGLVRLFMVLASWDTGSSFEEMGATRDISFAVFVEPALFLTLASLVKKTSLLSLSPIYTRIAEQPYLTSAAFIFLTVCVLFIILLVENYRMPIDDPNTHLELTMVHEVMILDYSSADLAYILYGSSLKLWIYGSLLVGLMTPLHHNFWLNEIFFFSGMASLAVVIGVLESILARLHLTQIFSWLILAFAIAAFTFLIL